MRIEVHLNFSLKKLAPEGNGRLICSLEPGDTLGHLLDRLGIPPSQGLIALSQGRYLKREDPLREGESLKLFPLLDGG